MKVLDLNFVKTKSESVVCRVDVHFDGFILKGFKIMRDKNKGTDYVTPPSYLSPQGWRPLFKTDTITDWQEISQRILNDFSLKQIQEVANEINTTSQPYKQ